MSELSPGGAIFSGDIGVSRVASSIGRVDGKGASFAFSSRNGLRAFRPSAKNRTINPGTVNAIENLELDWDVP